jgi:hypothetical protein
MTKTNFIRCLFILNAFVCLARLDSGLCSDADHSPAITRAFIELVVSENPSYNITSYRTISSPAQPPELSINDPALSSINKFTLIDYNAFALRVLNLSNNTRNHFFPLVTILQKCSAWHQSSDDLPPMAV